MQNLRQGRDRGHMNIIVQPNEQITWIDIILILVVAVFCSLFKSQLRADYFYKGIKRK